MEKLGERIRKRREHLDITINTLAKSTGISPSMLSQMEHGKAFPSLHTIKHIADFLNTSVGELIGENDTHLANPVIEWNDRKFVKKNNYGASLYLLAEHRPQQTMEVFMLEMEPVATSVDLIEDKRNGQEYCFVIEGSITVSLLDREYILSERASMCFFSHDFKHFKNHSLNKSYLLWNIASMK
ncbi:MAG TPA: XRE family transcriptional regulator [Bacteroidales bacterium]